MESQISHLSAHLGIYLKLHPETPWTLTSSRRTRSDPFVPPGGPPPPSPVQYYLFITEQSSTFQPSIPSLKTHSPCRTRTVPPCLRELVVGDLGGRDEDRRRRETMTTKHTSGPWRVPSTLPKIHQVVTPATYTILDKKSR